MHVAFGSSDEPQVFVWEKSAALMPATLIPLKETAAVPLFWSVTVCGADENPTAVFAKLTLDGLACNAGEPACGISATWKSDGAALSWGWNGAEGDTRPNSDAVLSEGLFARFSNAESVSVRRSRIRRRGQGKELPARRRVSRDASTGVDTRSHHVA